MRRKSAFSCTIMRGGTSKGIFLRAEELPQDPGLRERIILAVFGSPDIRQIDGLGGADSLTSKLALVSPAGEPGRDVDYTFGAVGIDRAFVDYSSNCGNISSAVGPYAIDRGLVKPVAPFTTVRIYNTNTRKMIYAKVPVKAGKVVSEGDYEIAGAPGSGARIDLTFMDPAGAVTGRLLPTGHAVDEIELASGERYAVTIVDAGNPTAFVRAEELNLIGDELPAAVDPDRDLRARLDAIRRKVAVLAGIPFSESIPKVCFVTPAREYRTAAGNGRRRGGGHPARPRHGDGKDAQGLRPHRGRSGGHRGDPSWFRGEPGGRWGAHGGGAQDRHRPSLGGDGCRGGGPVRKRGAAHRELYGGPDRPQDHGGARLYPRVRLCRGGMRVPPGLVAI